MKQIIECPFCETRLTLVKFSAKKPLQCPRCQQSFSRDEAIEPRSPREPFSQDRSRHASAARPTSLDAAVARLAPESLVSFDKSVIRSSAGNATNPPAAKASLPMASTGDGSTPESSPTPLTAPVEFISAEPALSQVSPTEGISDPESPSAVLSKVEKYKRKQHLFFLLFNLSLILLALVFASIFWRLLHLQPEVPLSAANTAIGDKADKAPDLTAPAIDTGVPDEEGRLDGTLLGIEDASLAIDEPEDPWEPLESFADPPPKLIFFTDKQAVAFWQELQPNLVNLKIEGAVGKRLGVGTIIDSRGWIVTSYQLVKDALRIEVTATLETPGASTEPPLKDLVRGVVAIDPRHDLAILAINRRFVRSLAEPKVSRENRLVVQSRLLVFCPLRAANERPYHEVAVEQRSKVSELPTDIQNKLERWEIGSPELTWLTLRGQNRWLPGMPLLDQSGAIQGIVSFADNDRAWVVSLDQLRGLITRASGKITPLGNGRGRQELSAGTESKASANHPMLQQLHQAAESCRDFQWIPQSEEQYVKLATLMEQLAAGQAYLRANPRDYRDSADKIAIYESLEHQLRQIGEELLERIKLGLAADQGLIESMNGLAKDELERKQSGFVPIVATVREDGLMLDHFLVKLVGKPTSIKLDFDDAMPVMRPGSSWIVAIELVPPNQRKQLRVKSGERILVHEGIQRIVLGPLPLN